MTNREAFRKNIRRLMDTRQCSQSDIAQYMGISKSTVSLWINGKAYPEVKNIEELARFFNVSVFELVCEDDSDEERMLRIFRVLSPKGKEKALERMEELKQLYWYDKNDCISM